MRRGSIVRALWLAICLGATSALGVGLLAGPLLVTADEVVTRPGAYGLAVTGAEQNYVRIDLPVQPPAGRKWVMVSATLQNLDGDTTVVEPGALTLVGDDGQRYTVEPPGELSRP